MNLLIFLQNVQIFHIFTYNQDKIFLILPITWGRIQLVSTPLQKECFGYIYSRKIGNTQLRFMFLNFSFVCQNNLRWSKTR